MPTTQSAPTLPILLPDRGVVSLTGADAGKLLQGLITNDMDQLKSVGDAMHSALLTPQGKILFAFFVVRVDDGFLLETERHKAADLAKRLTFYKLRAVVRIEDVSSRWSVAASWRSSEAPARRPGTIIFADPRDARMG